MWPFGPWDNVNWGDTAQMLIGLGSLTTAVAAIIVIFWNTRRFNQEAHRRELARRADSRLDWNEKFRSEVAQFISISAIQRKFAIENPERRFDEQRALAAQETYYRLKLLLRPGEHHFDEFEKSLYSAIEASPGDNADYTKAIGDLEVKARAVISVEYQTALKELNGKELWQ